MPAQASYSVCDCQVTMCSYLGPNEIRLLNICNTFPWQQEWGNLETCQKYYQLAIFFLPRQSPIFPKKATLWDEACMPNLFCRRADCPDTTLSSPDRQQRRRTRGNHSDINTASDPCRLNPSGPSLIQLKGRGPMEWSWNKHHHPSCRGSRDTGIDSGVVGGSKHWL